ncbi:hypothetical protein GUJ93_ZPchr0004g38417 [Zizania palustris]|uniref:Uncharacterized protein n=1 Tax=Zizania palustris TaxID=103762 RepID=A0A8J5VYK2_ZIZPA|nr:hypothetical protein GUJ93_ZPchr0004g38417 [Zizania palustris]
MPSRPVGTRPHPPLPPPRRAPPPPPMPLMALPLRCHGNPPPLPLDSTVAWPMGKAIDAGGNARRVASTEEGRQHRGRSLGEGGAMEGCGMRTVRRRRRPTATSARRERRELLGLHTGMEAVEWSTGKRGCGPRPA